MHLKLLLYLLLTAGAYPLTMHKHSRRKDMYIHQHSSQIKVASFVFSILIVGVDPILFSTHPPLVHAEVGTTQVDGEILRIFNKGKQNEVDGAVDEAQGFYEQVVQTEPDFVYGWSSLGNVLVTRGNLDQALLCYRKAISLRPPSEELASILLNKASIELATDKTDAAMKDLDLAEQISGPTKTINTVKAVALSNSGKWKESSEIFEKVIQTADKNALPWWLRYSMSLLESGRGTEAIAFLQRTISRFPDEAECKAFAAALYTSQGVPLEGGKYWNKMLPEDRDRYSDILFVQQKLKWGPTSTAALKTFLGSKFSEIVPQKIGELYMDPLSKYANGI